MGIGTVITTILFAATIIGGSLYLLGAAVAMWRAPDALSRMNQLSAGVTVGAPLLVVGNAILEFDQGTLTVGKTLTGLLAIVAMLVVATVASEVLARAVLGSRDGSEDHPTGTECFATATGPLSPAFAGEGPSVIRGAGRWRRGRG